MAKHLKQYEAIIIAGAARADASVNLLLIRKAGSGYQVSTQQAKVMVRLLFR